MIEFIRTEVPSLFPLDPDPGKLRVLNEPLEDHLRRLLSALPEGTRWKLEYVPTPELAAELAGAAAFTVRGADGEVRPRGQPPERDRSGGQHDRLRV